MSSHVVKEYASSALDHASMKHQKGLVRVVFVGVNGDTRVFDANTGRALNAMRAEHGDNVNVRWVPQHHLVEVEV